MIEFLQQALDILLQYSWIDYLALSSGIAYVLLAAKENPLCWLAGLVNVSCFFVISYHAKMYSDMGLQVVYFFLTVYGWWTWMYGGTKKTTLQITPTSLQLWSLLISITAGMTLIIYFLLVNYTDTDVAFWDALTTALSLTATWMLIKKKLENWLVWVVVDPIYVGLFYYKGYQLSSLLFGIYTIIAVIGYFQWRRNMLQAQSAIS